MQSIQARIAAELGARPAQIEAAVATIAAITTLRAQLEVTQDKLEIERALTDGAHRRARDGGWLRQA